MTEQPSTTASATASATDSTLGFGNPMVRSIVSLALVIHFICLSACFFSVFQPSPFDARLLGVLSPYLQSLNFDLDQTPYYLTLDPINENTQAFFDERTYAWEFLPQGQEDVEENWRKLADQAAGWGGPQRFQRWAQTAAMFSEQEDFEAAIVQGIAKYFQSTAQTKIAKVRLRLQRPLTQQAFQNNLTASPDPNAIGQFQTLYTAIVLQNNDGQMSVIRESSLRESAPPDASNAESEAIQLDSDTDTQ